MTMASQMLIEVGFVFTPTVALVAKRRPRALGGG
jgi:hypothetical protein